jgi:hypothetical protein
MHHQNLLIDSGRLTKEDREKEQAQNAGKNQSVSKSRHISASRIFICLGSEEGYPQTQAKTYSFAGNLSL